MTIMLTNAPVDEELDNAGLIVQRAIERLARDWQAPPDLDDLAAEAGLSPAHFQKLFKRRAGVSPKRFAQFVTLGHARRLLREERGGLLDAAYDLGLSGPSRLHDLFVVAEACTPGEYKAAGAGLTIRWGVHDVPLGRALLAATPRGLCWLSFVAAPGTGKGLEENLAELRAEWPAAGLVEDPAATASMAARAFEGVGEGPVTVHLRGTNFQLKVWQALLAIPFGQVTTYDAVARSIGRPGANRAVGNAVGANPISFVIPCHRVIRKTGVLDNYRWGPARKRALLAWEAARLAG
ncbi:methylated-DNA--[protein]-cysteine S-methyltransferase [Indioceanicola profundi]|uniref:methylated-DNA--[protein]-cysteine S-methyltransferase n=1 Tax=Indioceanicola profundi TaxID=2220096 RepID=UPI0013C405F0|nr:methylated-DNA--[protein]-cysteine S-methyltransferase [Indioceanicola profundi]